TLVSPNELRLTLPSSSSNTVAPQSFTISIKDKGTYFLHGKEMNLGHIECELLVALCEQKDTSPTVVIAADKSTQLDYPATAMNMANRLNAQAIIATEPGK